MRGILFEREYTAKRRLRLSETSHRRDKKRQWLGNHTDFTGTD